jgi:Uma2 family endonuclease
LATTPRTGLMTFAEFERLPDVPGLRYELRHGEVFQVPPAKYPHFLIQQILRDLLDQAAANRGRAYTEVGFRPLPDHEFFIVDVAYASTAWWLRSRKTEYLTGAPELVIEILSPSNSAAEMLDKEKLCLENGAQEFWLVDPDRRQVKVSTPDGRTITYRRGQIISVTMVNGTISVDAIFPPAELSAEG